MKKIKNLILKNKKELFLLSFFFIILFSSTSFSFAAPTGGIKGLITTIKDLLNDYVIPLLITIALVYFLFGVVKYIAAGGDEKKREEGKNIMLWGILALFVMVSVWGLVNVLIGTFNLDTSTPEPPVFQF